MTRTIDIIELLTQDPWLVVIVDLTCKATCVLLLALAFVWCLRRSSAAARHLVWSLAIIGLPLIPALACTLPNWKIPIYERSVVPPTGTGALIVLPPSWAEALARVHQIDDRDDLQSRRQQTHRLQSHSGPVATVGGEVFPHRNPSGESQNRIGALRQKDRPQRHSSTNSPKATAESVVADSFVVVERTRELPTALHQRPSVLSWHSIYKGIVWISRLSYGQLFVFIWSVGVLIALFPTCVSILRLRWLHWTARQVADPEWADVVLRASSRLGLHRAIDVLEHPEVNAPLTWGVIRPVVLLPPGTSNWSDDRRYVVMLHELAHVQRYDVLTQLIARVVCAVFWFHPLVWWAAAQLRNEQEMACDDRVLSQNVVSTSYAQHLLDVARSTGRLGNGRTTVSGSTAVGSTVVAASLVLHARLEDRLRAILDGRRSRRTLSPGMVLIAASIAFVGLLPLSTAGVVFVVPENYDAVPARQTADETTVDSWLDSLSTVNQIRLNSAAARAEKKLSPRNVNLAPVDSIAQ